MKNSKEVKDLSDYFFQLGKENHKNNNSRMACTKTAFLTRHKQKQLEAIEYQEQNKAMQEV